MYFVRGASFEKKEFKRNLAGSVSYPPVYGSVVVSKLAQNLIQKTMAKVPFLTGQRSMIDFN
jgi:hypothetical protein